jgi:hypothetical protein
LPHAHRTFDDCNTRTGGFDTDEKDGSRDRDRHVVCLHIQVTSALFGCLDDDVAIIQANTQTISGLFQDQFGLGAHFKLRAVGQIQHLTRVLGCYDLAVVECRAGGLISVPEDCHGDE